MDILELDDESKIAQRWLSFCRSHSNVKCIEYDVPAGILPNGYRGTLIDVKVQGKSRWGSDDKVYSQNEDLREKVARGNCVLELHTIQMDHGHEQITSTKYLFLIFALRKFSGGLGDEDDSEAQNMWQNYFIKPISSAKSVICTTKANGEAAHVSCCSIGGQTFFAVGSKNVHMLVKTIDDIQKYTDSRFEIARIIAKTFFSHIMNEKIMEVETLNSLIDYLQSTRCTAVFEILQPNNQHVVNLSYLTDPELRFICWVDPYSENECNTLSIAPNHGIEKARSLGLFTIDYNVISPEDADDEMSNIRTGWGYEGKVLYFVDADDQVFGLIKKKTRWYIILRAIREKAAAYSLFKKESSMSSGDMKVKMTKRLKEIQVWLGFSNEYRQTWIELACKFLQWVKMEYQRDPSSKNSVRSQFPPLWARFLETHERERGIYDNLKDAS